MSRDHWLDRVLWLALLIAPCGGWALGARHAGAGGLVGLLGLEVAVAGLLLGRRRALLRRAHVVRPGRSFPSVNGGLAADPWGDRATADLAAQLFQDAERSAEQLVAAQVQLLSFLDAVRGMAGAAGRAQVVDALLLHCQRRYQAAAVACYWREGADRLNCRLLALRDGDLQLAESRQPEPASGGLAVVLGEGRSLLIGDAAHHPLGATDEAGMFPGSGGYLAVPLWRPGRGGQSGDKAVAGAIVLADPDRTARLDGDVRASLEALGHAAGLVLENTSLYERLSREHELRDGILQSLTSGLVAYDPEGKLLFHNQAALDLLGVEAGSLASLAPAELFPDLAPAGPLLSALQGGHKALSTVETQLPRPQRAPLSARLTVAPLRRSPDEAPGLLCLFDDLTPLRAMQDQIRQLDKLAAIGRFTSSLAHEIRNPLAGIAAGIDYLRRDAGLGPEHHEYIKIINQEIERLDRIIRNLFTVARPGGLLVQRCSLAAVLTRVLAFLGPLAASKGVRLQTELRPAWRDVECDEDQIQQVLLNLVKNAVEAEVAGGAVRILVEPDGDDPEADGNGRPRVLGLAICVENGGEGIPPEEMEKIFEPFYTRKSQGTGLGLFVSYNVVKQHGGTLEAQSEPGGLTRFRVWLPCVQPRTPEGA